MDNEWKAVRRDRRLESVAQGNVVFGCKERTQIIRLKWDVRRNRATEPERTGISLMHNEHFMNYSHLNFEFTKEMRRRKLKTLQRNFNEESWPTSDVFHTNSARKSTSIKVRKIIMQRNNLKRSVPVWIHNWRHAPLACYTRMYQCPRHYQSQSFPNDLSKPLRTSFPPAH